MTINKLQAVSDLALALSSAELHLPRHYDADHIAEPLDFMMFVQSWSDTSLGFGGLAGQAFTDGTVVVCWRQAGHDAAVFVGGRLAYVVQDDDPRRADFWLQLRTRQNVYGQARWVDTCQHRQRKNSNVCHFCGRATP